MKKIPVILAVALCLSGMTIPVFAATAPHKKADAVIHVVHGTVVSVDTAKNEIMVKDAKTGQERTFAVSAKASAVLKAGEKVKVKVKEGSNMAENVKVVKTGSGQK